MIRSISAYYLAGRGAPGVKGSPPRFVSCAGFISFAGAIARSLTRRWGRDAPGRLFTRHDLMYFLTGMTVAKWEKPP